SIWLTVGNLTGTGLMIAHGGPGETPLGGGGGGGRIAIYYTGTNNFNGTISARGGLGANNGSAGTIYSKSRTNSYAQLIIDNGGLIATNTILNFVGQVDLTIRGQSTAGYTGTLGPIGSLLIESNSFLSPAASFPQSFILNVSNA